MHGMIRLGITAGLALMVAAAAPDERRIEDFRQDLTASEIAAAESLRARALASQAYVWGLPAFLHYRQATEFKQGRRMLAPEQEPFGGWTLVRNLATPTTNNALPNVDTLYGASYVDLARQGPIRVSLPDMPDRYHSVAILDAWFNNFAILGTSKSAGRAATYLVVPPGWRGERPQGVAEVLVAPTPMIVLLQRIYVRDAADVPAVRALQDKITIKPLNGDTFPRFDSPEFDVTSPVRATRDPLAYFDIVNRYTDRNRPTGQYDAMMAAIADAGLGPGQALPDRADLRSALVAGARDAQVAIDAAVSAGPFRNGWRIPDPRGAIPGPYAFSQAVLQISQIGSLPINEAVYFVGRRDAAGALLRGDRGYRLTFPAGALPPVREQGFWSVTLYKASDNLLHDNPLNRYVIRPSTPGLTPNADGSLTLVIAHDRPAKTPAGNWLPAPKDGFLLAIRAYRPTPEIGEGRWFPAALEPLK